MTDINTILDNGWDTNICSKPSFIKLYNSNYRGYQRVITTILLNINDELIGVITRQYYDPESHDAYRCIIVSNTEADLKNMIKAVKKVCVTYTPVTGEENILQWDGGDWGNFNNIYFKFEFIILKRKSGMVGY